MAGKPTEVTAPGSVYVTSLADAPQSFQNGAPPDSVPSIPVPAVRHSRGRRVSRGALANAISACAPPAPQLPNAAARAAAVPGAFYSPARREQPRELRKPLLATALPPATHRLGTNPKATIIQAYQTPDLRDQRRVSQDVFVTAVTDDAPSAAQRPRRGSKVTVTQAYQSPAHNDQCRVSREVFVTQVTDDASPTIQHPRRVSRASISSAYPTPARHEQGRVSRQAFATALTADAPAATPRSRSASRATITEAYPDLTRQERRKPSHDSLVTNLADYIPFPAQARHSVSRAANMQPEAHPMPKAAVATPDRGMPTSDTWVTGEEHSQPDYRVLCIVVYLAAMVLALVSTVMYVVVSLDVGGPSVVERTEDVDTTATPNVSRPATASVPTTASARQRAQASNYDVTRRAPGN